MNLLTGSKLLGLQRKSENIFGVFNRTLSKLNRVNAQIEAEQTKIEEDMAKKQTEHATLEAIKLRNLKFSNKLTEMVS